MVEHDLLISPRADLFIAEPLIESCCAEAGLRVTLKGTLAAYPGCVHWHLKRGNDKGTLEITL